MLFDFISTNTYNIRVRNPSIVRFLFQVLVVISTSQVNAQSHLADIENLQQEGSSLINKRAFEEAYARLKKSESLLSPEHVQLVIHNNLLMSKLFMYQQQSDSALHYGQLAYSQATEIAIDTLILESNLAIGEAFHYAAGNSYRAIYYFEEAERALSSYPYTVGIKYRTYYNLLVCNRAIGKIDNALQYGGLLEDLIDTQSGELSSTAIANCYYVIGNNYLEMYSTKALNYFLKADSIMEAKSGPSNYYQLNYYYPQMSIYYNQHKDHEKALQYLKEIELRSPQSYRTNRQNIINQAWTYLQLKDYRTADSLALASLPLAKNLTDSVFTFSTLGKIALEAGQPRGAIKWLKMAVSTLYTTRKEVILPDVDALADPYNEPDIYGYMGHCYLMLAQHEGKADWLNKAHKYLWFGLQSGLVNRPSVRHHNAQITLTRHIKSAYTWLLDYYYYQYEQCQSLVYIDTAAMLINHAKASIIKSKSRMFQSVAIPDSLKKERSRLLLEINELKRKAAHADSIFSRFARLEEIDNEISQIQNIYEESLFDPLPSIDDETLTINYLWGGDALYAVTDGKTKRFIKRTDITKTDSLTRSFYNLVSQPVFDDFQEYQKTGFALYQSLLATLLPKDLPSHLVIVPDEQLLSMPFEALPTSNNSTNFYDTDYLIRRMNISYAPYLENDQSREVVKKGKSAVSFAYNRKEETQLPNYLKNVEQESYLFNTIMDGQSYIATEASETNYKAINTKSAIQHLAMHGTASEDIPYIRFRSEADQDNDGKLYEYEIYNTHLSAELIILTACESNLGEIASSEGSISLSRAFLGAGAHSVISSLWTLNDDASVKVFELFLSNYQNPEDPPSALSEAKRSYLLKADEIVAHPYFWAGLVIQRFSIENEMEKMRENTITVLLYCMLSLGTLFIMWMIAKNVMRKL